MRKIKVRRDYKHNYFNLIESAANALEIDDLFEDSIDEFFTSKYVFPIPVQGLWNFNPNGLKSFDAYNYLEDGGLKYFSNPGCLLCLDAAGEGFPIDDHILFYMHDKFREYNLHPSQVLFLSSAFDAGERYNDWCLLNSAAPIMRVLSIDVQYYYYSGKWKSHRNELERMYEQYLRILKTGNIRKSKFLCLNYMPRPSRYAVVLHLIENNLLDQCLISFFGSHSENDPLDPDRNSRANIVNALNNLGQSDQTIRHLDELESLLPLSVTPQSTRLQNAYTPSSSDPYLHSYINIVTESDFEGSGGGRLTEKTFKPISCLQMFLIVGAHNSLLHLRRMGFRTFSGLIDESYDEIISPRERLRAVLAEISRLGSMNMSELATLTERAHDVLFHNFTLFHFLAASKLKDEPAIKFMKDWSAD